MSNKITCATCVNEQDKRCVVKKDNVALNKRRNCDKYVLEPLKVKAKQILKTTRLSYREKEALRQRYKKELKEVKAAAKQGYNQQNAKHPLTGDLSKFTSTAGRDRSGR